ncbi:Replication termination factor 2 [Dipsacomyces acuminosporus]|nr:Replication termination factor 2 [Dipsacomyces acuminosporus]
MGNDGGSIPRRNEMVKEKKKDEQVDKKSQIIAMYFFCALSKQELQEPIVGDALGRLYNREAILEYLLDKSSFGDGDKICGHIKSLKDVKTLNLKANPAYSSAIQTNGQKKQAILSFDEQKMAKFVCPVTMKEMNGNSPFEFVWSCGCVFSAQARKEMAGLNACLVCSGPFDSRDVIPINSQDAAVLESLRQRMKERKHEKKKAKDKPKHKRKREAQADLPALPGAAASAGVEEKAPKVRRARA